jgi:hypothetical protein
MSESGDRCSRAAAAAIEVVRDECSGLDVEVMEVRDGVLIEVPEDDAEMFEDPPSTPEELAEDIRSSTWFRDYIANTVGPKQNDSMVTRVMVYQAVDGLYGGLPFDHDDLEGSGVLDAL